MVTGLSRAVRFVAGVTACLLGIVLLGDRPAHAQTADEFFSGQSLEDVWVHINARDWQTLRARFQESTFYPCDVQWRTVRVSNAGCRSRGSGSRSGTKPGLDVHFDHYVGGQKFLGLSQLVLDNLWQDPSLLQERLTMWLFRRVGVAAPREAHVRLFAGSGRDFMGVYSAVEAIEPTFLERSFAQRNAYLYEYRWQDVYHFEDLGNELEPYAARFAARTHTFESMFALYHPIRELIATINDAPLERIAELLDLTSLTRELAVENFVSDWDGLLGYAGLNNFYLSRDGDTPAHVIPWDKDAEFVNVALLPSHNFEFNVLARKIWEDPVAVREYLQDLLILADAGPALSDELEREFAQIESTALADRLKSVTNEDFEAAVEQLRVFLNQRPAIVRTYVRQLAPELVSR